MMKRDIEAKPKYYQNICLKLGSWRRERGFVMIKFIKKVCNAILLGLKILQLVITLN